MHGSHFVDLIVVYDSVNRVIEILQPTIGEACMMTEKLSVDKALEKLRGSNKPKSRMTLLDEKK